ncbi:MAG: collagen-like protein [Ilumatobacter sp.]
MHRRFTTVVGAGALVATSLFVGTQFAAGATTAEETVFVPIAPCRLVDTRPGDLNVGPVDEPVGEGQDVTFTAWGTGDANSPCDLPATATAIATNTTVANPTARTFVTLYPADVANPGTSNLNVLAGDSPTPNSANIPLSAQGAFTVFNNRGNVNVIIDVNGYFQPSSAIGATGPAGEDGPIGPEGPIGPDGATGPAGPAGGSDTGHTLTSVDTLDSVGRFTSTAIGTNGNPIISYQDETNGNLLVAACDDPACSTATINVVDPAPDAGRSTSIAIGTDGNPVISYLEEDNFTLQLAACSDPICSAPPTITTVDSTTDAGYDSSIAIGANGNPIISYSDGSLFDLKVAACDNSTCTSSTITTLDSADQVGSSTSIAIGTDGNPVISYYDSTNSDLKIVTCSDAACLNSTNRTVDSNGRVGISTSITIAASGNPIISYFDDTEFDLKVAACSDATCTSADITTLDDAGIVGLDTSITIGNDDNPIISYYDATNDDLRVAACTDSTCTAATVSTLDTGGDGGNVGQWTSIAIGTDGKPVVAYYDGGNEDLKVASCGNATCASYTPRNR